MHDITCMNVQTPVTHSATTLVLEESNECEDQLSISTCSVIWNRGSIIHKILSFDGNVLDARFCSFDGVKNREKCLCVLLGLYWNVKRINHDQIKVFKFMFQME
jgi:hypothetical protein